MQRPKAILFDLDGTLLDSATDIGLSCNRALAQHGLPVHPVDRYVDFVGEGVDVLIARAMAPLPPDPAVTATYKSLYPLHMLDHTRPYEGVPELLQRLADAGIALGVLSNKPHPATNLLVRHFFGPDRFAAVAGQRPDVPRKPDPAAALELCDRMGALPSETVFVGDTAVDLQTARNAAMASIGCLWGFRPQEVSAADAVAADPLQIAALLLGSIS